MKKYGLQKLLDDIDIHFEGNNIPSWFGATLLYAMFSLPVEKAQRDGQITLEYYLSDLTLTDLGKKYSITQERVRQIVTRCVRKLRRAEVHKLLTVGVKEYYSRAAYETGVKDGIKQAMKHAYIDHKFREENVDILTQELWELDISTRLRNCLYRSKFMSMTMVIEAGAVNMHKVKNLGKALYKELVDFLVNYCGEKRENWE